MNCDNTHSPFWVFSQKRSFSKVSSQPLPLRLSQKFTEFFGAENRGLLGTFSSYFLIGNI